MEFKWIYDKHLTNKKLAKYLVKHYFKNHQRLYLHGGFVPEKGKFHSQEVYVVAEYTPRLLDQLKSISKRSGRDLQEIKYKAKKAKLFKEEYYGKFLFEIRTLDDLVGYTKLGCTPYFMYEDNWPVFTVPKFGDLTEEDIFQAIDYFIKKVLQAFHIFNMYYEDKQVSTKYKLERYFITQDIQEIRSWKYWEEKSRKKRKVRAVSKSKITRQQARKAAKVHKITTSNSQEVKIHNIKVIKE